MLYNLIVRLLLLFALFIGIKCSSGSAYKVSSAKDAELDTLSAEQKQKLVNARKFLNLANESFQKGEYEKSIEESQQSVKEYPIAEAYFILGSSLYRKEKYTESKDAYNEALKLKPNSEEILLSSALVLATLGENENVLKTYDRLLVINPAENLYIFKKGVALKALKRYQESYTELKKVPEDSFLNKSQLYMQLGDAAFQLKKYKEAEGYFKKAKEYDMSLQDADSSANNSKFAESIDRGNSFLALKNYDEAAKNFKEAIKISPEAYLPYYFLGNALFLKGKYKDSEEALLQSISKNKNFKDSHLLLAGVYHESGKYKKSSVKLEEIIKTFGEDARLRNRLGLSYKMAGNYKKALLSFMRARELDPNDKNIAMNLGYFFMEEEKYAEALKEFQKLKTQHPGDKKIDEAIKLCEIATIIDTGDLLLRRGEKDKALLEYDKAKKIKKDSPLVLNAFGRYHFINKNYEDSEKSYKSTLKHDSKNIAAIIGLVRLYGEQGMQVEQKEYLKKLDSFSGESSLSALAIGRVLEDREELKQAESYYKSLLTKYPDTEAVHFRLGLVYYKRALKLNEEEKFDEALKSLELASAENPDIPELKATSKVIRENSKMKDILPLLKSGNNYYESAKYTEAIGEYRKAYDKMNRNAILIRIARCHLEAGEAEKSFSILKNAIEKEKENKQELQEALGAHYIRVGQFKSAEAVFDKVISENPEAYYSYYQTGVIYLNKDRNTALKYFDTAVAINSEYAPPYIARGITYYKMGNKTKAREEFHLALKKDVSRELASFNLAMILVNDDLYEDGEKILLEITKDYPSYPDPYYQLAYINFNKGKIHKAEKYLLKNLELSRSAAALNLYLKILDSKKQEAGDDSFDEKIRLTRREILEKYPSSDIAKSMQTKWFEAPEKNTLLQKFELLDKMVTPPVYANGTFIVNYGYSLSRINIKTRSTLWRVETPSAYSLIAAGPRLYGVTGSNLEAIDIETGKKIWSAVIPITSAERIEVGDYILIYGKDASKKKMLYSLELTGEVKASLPFSEKSSWLYSSEGYIYQFNEMEDGLEWNIYDTAINPVKTGQMLLLAEKPKIYPLGCLSIYCYLRTANRIYRFEPSGSFKPSDLFEPGIDFAAIRSSKIYVQFNETISSMDRNFFETTKYNFKEKIINLFELDNSVLVSEKSGQFKILGEKGEIKLETEKSSGSSKSLVEIFSLLYE